MADYESILKDKKNQLIRKSLQMSVFIGDPSLAIVDETALFTTATGVIKALPTGYEDLGWTTTDGAQFSRSVTSSDVTSAGSTEPTRSDITADTTTMQVSAQETKLLTLGIYTGADLSSYVTDDPNGSITVEQSSKPVSRYYRVLGIGVDDTDDGEFYLVRSMPRAKVSDYADQALNNGDDPALWGFTFQAFEDSVAGYANAYILGGPGCLSLALEMGATLGT